MALIGIKAGDVKDGQAGARCPRITLAVDAAGEVATIGDRRIKVTPDVLVMWYESDSGTFHGVVDAVVARTVTPAPRLEVGKDVPGVLLRSASGGADIAALAMRPDRPVAVVTSGYKGRTGWLLTVVTPGPNGLEVETVEPRAYRARYAEVEAL